MLGHLLSLGLEFIELLLLLLGDVLILQMDSVFMSELLAFIYYCEQSRHRKVNFD